MTLFDIGFAEEITWFYVVFKGDQIRCTLIFNHRLNKPKKVWRENKVKENFHEKWFDPATISLNIIHSIQFSLMLLRRHHPPIVKNSENFTKYFLLTHFLYFFFFLFKLITTLGSTAYEDIWKLRPKTRKKKKINVEQIYTFFSTFSWVCLSSNKIHNNYITIGKTKTFVTMTGKYSIVDCWLLNNELTHQASFHHQPNVLF